MKLPIYQMIHKDSESTKIRSTNPFLQYILQQMTSIIDSMVNPETYTQFLVRSKTIPQKYFRWSWLLSRARSYILICSRRPANYSPTNLLRITLHGPPLGVKIAWLLNLMSVRLQSFNPKYTNTISQFDPIVVLFLKPCSLRILRSKSYFFITTFLTFYLFFSR